MLENNAQEFVNTPFSLNFFPHGDGNLAKPVLQISNPVISLSAFYQDNSKYVLRLLNNNAQHSETAIILCGKRFSQSFSPYEVKTLIYDGNSFLEMDCWM